MLILYEQYKFRKSAQALQGNMWLYAGYMYCKGAQARCQKTACERNRVSWKKETVWETVSPAND